MQATEQKMLIVGYDPDGQFEINSELRDGWSVLQMVAQHVAPGTPGDQNYGNKPVVGRLAVLLERSVRAKREDQQ